MIRCQVPGLSSLLTCCTVLSLLLSLWCSALCAQNTPIRFAPLPMENREALVLQFRPMMEYLEQKLNRPIIFDFSESYDRILEKFLTNKIDLAYLGPLPYVELRAKDAHAEPLIHFREASGRPMYTCAIVSVADNPIKLQALNNHHIALTQPLSTCGYLSVNGLLQERGSNLADNRYRYLDKHDVVALAVIRGEFDLGGLKTAIGKRYTHMGLKILAETPPFPGFGLIGNQKTLSQKTLEAIRQAMIQLDPAGADKELLGRWGGSIRYGAVQATDSDYQTVRKYKGNLEIPTGNKE
ncbi:MAG: PhnD/SsuA/transferrin family substrate-binding protein [Desulfobulbus sp.]|nr:PhnD/SsuA/transferrin family substrate-binding protein [Desulfobulbus sp.]